MKWTWIVGGLVALLVIGVVGAVAIVYGSLNRTVIWDEPAQTIADIVEGWASLPSVPGVLLHVQTGERVVVSTAAGHLAKRSGAALTPQTPFHTASVGKLFTAVTVLRLHERGVLDLEDPAVRHLAEARLRGLVVIDGEDFGNQITLRQLLAHRAGLGNTDQDIAFNVAVLTQPGKRWTPQELLAQARQVPAIARPGEQTSYASPGYYLLGLVIESVTRRPYHEAVRAEIFTPLAMDATFESTWEWNHKAETLHHYAGVLDLSRYDPSFEFADGGFVTTAEDMVRFGLALANGGIFDDPQTADLMVSAPDAESQSLFYQGLGPFVGRPPDAPWFLSHSGFWGVHFTVYPETETVAVMSEDGTPVSRGCRE